MRFKLVLAALAFTGCSGPTPAPPPDVPAPGELWCHEGQGDLTRWSCDSRTEPGPPHLLRTRAQCLANRAPARRPQAEAHERGPCVRAPFPHCFSGQHGGPPFTECAPTLAECDVVREAALRARRFMIRGVGGEVAPEFKQARERAKRRVYTACVPLL